MNGAEIAFQICMNVLFYFGESNSDGEEHTGQMTPPLRQGEEGKMTPLSCRAMSAAGNISFPLSPQVRLGVPAEFVPC